MTILALEFSSPHRSVALADGGGSILAEAAAATDGRGTDAFGLIEQALAKAGLPRTAIEAVAVGLGPGSYTGIRAAIAVAQGWHLACGVHLIGVSSIASLAAQAQAQKICGRVNLVVDAQRGEFYRAIWDITATHRQELSPLEIIPATEILAQKDTGEVYAGPEMERRLFPSAATIARLAVGSWGSGLEERLEPIYLRATSFVKAPAIRIV
jgi:tRNA threonylcarbamoyladenosine biosynthesis protein TsaB